MSDNTKYLNDILKFLYDSKGCYKDHAEHAQQASLKGLFSGFNQQREAFISEIKEAIKDFGGDPSEYGTIIGTLHLLLEDIKSYITNGDPVAIAKEIRRSESLLIERYLRALTEADFSQDLKATLIGQMKTIDENIRDMDINLVTV